MSETPPKADVYEGLDGTWRVSCGSLAFVGTPRIMAAHVGFMMQEVLALCDKLAKVTWKMGLQQGVLTSLRSEKRVLREQLVEAEAKGRREAMEEAAIFCEHGRVEIDCDRHVGVVMHDLRRGLARGLRLAEQPQEPSDEQ